MDTDVIKQVRYLPDMATIKAIARMGGRNARDFGEQHRLERKDMARRMQGWLDDHERQWNSTGVIKGVDLNDEHLLYNFPTPLSRKTIKGWIFALSDEDIEQPIIV